MTDGVAALRSFNRIVTERIGALQDQYLARSRPLGPSRVLWEVGPDGTDVRTLRSRLSLDSGYLSRLLRSLESDGLITVTPHPSDTRVRSVDLTTKGKAERTVLDSESDALAESLLAPLSTRQRDELIGAVDTVERLLTAGLVRIDAEDPSTDDAQQCLGHYFAELNRRFDTGYDPSIALPFDLAEHSEPGGVLLLARLRTEPVGCGALKFDRDQPAEIKRMWVSPLARGLGVGRRLLAALEELASSRGERTVRLETNRNLSEAIGMYRAAGYVEVDPFNDEPFAHHWFQKTLG